MGGGCLLGALRRHAPARGQSRRPLRPPSRARHRTRRLRCGIACCRLRDDGGWPHCLSRDHGYRRSLHHAVDALDPRAGLHRAPRASSGDRHLGRGRRCRRGDRTHRGRAPLGVHDLARDLLGQSTARRTRTHRHARARARVARSEQATARPAGCGAIDRRPHCLRRHGHRGAGSGHHFGDDHIDNHRGRLPDRLRVVGAASAKAPAAHGALRQPCLHRGDHHRRPGVRRAYGRDVLPAAVPAAGPGRYAAAVGCRDAARCGRALPCIALQSPLGRALRHTPHRRDRPPHRDRRTRLGRLPHRRLVVPPCRWQPRSHGSRPRNGPAPGDQCRARFGAAGAGGDGLGGQRWRR